MFGTREKVSLSEIIKAINLSAGKHGPTGCMASLKTAQPVRS
jgi:hypothetical protein